MPYPWSAGNVLTATDLNSSLAAKTDTAMTQNAQTGTSYSYVLLDAAKLLTMNNAASNTVTVTKQATVTWVTGTQLRIMNLGAGVTTLVADTGVTINGNVALKQYQGGTLIRTASDVWLFVPTVSVPSSATASVATSQTTSSATFTDLATVGPSVTLATRTKALVIVTAYLYNNTVSKATYAGFAISGASTVAASDANSVALYSDYITVAPGASLGIIVTGLTAGSNTFTMKYRTTGGTATFINRSISVVDMGS